MRGTDISTLAPENAMKPLPALILFVLSPAALPAVAQAGEAADAVRPFYDHPGLELDPAARGRFVDPAKKVLDQNDAIRAEGSEEGCLDPALPFDDTEYDIAEVARSLNLSEAVKGDDADVLATFKTPDGMARIEWKLKKADGAWKVADIVSMSKDWALSQFNCE
jgi:hypothetical protein